MEKYFSPADLIIEPSGANGTITATGIPEGPYYVRITRRNPLGNTSRPLGPPEKGDYTWVQAAPITITTGTNNLGTKTARAYGSAPVSISGTVTNWSGIPVSGRYVKATIKREGQAHTNATGKSTTRLPTITKQREQTI